MKSTLAEMVLKYLRCLAKIQLKKYAADIVGITGSAGKTSCRNAVSAILQEKYKLKVTGRANSESGIPLDILGLSPIDYSIKDWLRMIMLAPIKLLTLWQPHEKYVVEMGIDSPDSPKNMEYLLTILRPRTAIFLNALPVHSQEFDKLVTGGDRRQEIIKHIANGKGKLIKSLPKNGLAILNADQKEVVEFSSQTQAEVMTFGKSKSADIRIGKIGRDKNGTIFEFMAQDETAELRLPYLLPDYYGETLAAALCINADEGNSLIDGCRLLSEHFKLDPGRMSTFDGVNGSTIIDSSYNASAEPTIGALKMLAELPAKRRYVVLGHMNELGRETDAEMEKVVTVARKVCDEVVRVEKGQLTVKQAIKSLLPKLSPGDYVLIKGSQNGVFLEIVVEALLLNKADVSKLCRRGSYWENQRQIVLK